MADIAPPAAATTSPGAESLPPQVMRFAPAAKVTLTGTGVGVGVAVGVAVGGTGVGVGGTGVGVGGERVGVAVGGGGGGGGGAEPSRVPSSTAPKSATQYHPYFDEAVYARAIPTCRSDGSNMLLLCAVEPCQALNAALPLLPPAYRFPTPPHE